MLRRGGGGRGDWEAGRQAFAWGSYKSAYRGQLGPLDVPVAVICCRDSADALQREVGSGRTLEKRRREIGQRGGGGPEEEGRRREFRNKSWVLPPFWQR